MTQNNISSSSIINGNPNQALNDAAVEGNIDLLHELIKRDPFILYRLPSTTSGATPAVLSLRLACKLGHFRFVSELLHLRPDLSEAVDPSDQSSTALHLACRSGDLEMVKCLISVNPNTCFIRDNQGMNPIHVAAERGYCEILNELIEVSPHAARVSVGGAIGDKIMHLCVKHNKLDALKLLADKVGDVMLLNAKDEERNTMLHIAVIHKQLEITKFLLDDSRIDKSVLNSDGLTPMDIHKSQQQRKQQQHVDVDLIDKELESELKRANALTAEEVRNNQKYYFGEWLEKEHSTLMIVASLIATIAFQGCLSPPGGTWQETVGFTNYTSGFGGVTPEPAPSIDDVSRVPIGDNFHFAGTAIAASDKYGPLGYFYLFNSMGLISSIIVLIFLISSQPLEKLSNMFVMVMMRISLLSMLLAYCCSIFLLTNIPKVEKLGPDRYNISYEPLNNSFWRRFFSVLLGCIFIILVIQSTLGMRKLARKLKELRSGREH